MWLTFVSYSTVSFSWCGQQGTRHKGENQASGRIKPKQIPDRSETDHTCHVNTIHLADSDEARSDEMDCFFRNVLKWPNHHRQVFKRTARCVSFIKLPNIFHSSHRDILSQCLFTCLPANITATMVISTTTTTTTTTATITSTVQALAKLCLQLPQPLQNLWLSLEYPGEDDVFLIVSDSFSMVS